MPGARSLHVGRAWWRRRIAPMSRTHRPVTSIRCTRRVLGRPAWPAVAAGPSCHGSPSTATPHANRHGRAAGADRGSHPRAGPRLPCAATAEPLGRRSGPGCRWRSDGTRRIDGMRFLPITGVPRSILVASRPPSAAARSSSMPPTRPASRGQQQRLLLGIGPRRIRRRPESDAPRRPAGRHQPARWRPPVPSRVAAAAAARKRTQRPGLPGPHHRQTDSAPPPSSRLTPPPAPAAVAALRRARRT